MGKNISISDTEEVQVKECIQEINKSINNMKLNIKLSDKESNKEDEMSNFISTFEELIQHTKLIEGIAGSINDVATKTNLLSLNASIEAARAGEAGRGFSVVAEEVKKLSVSTKELVLSMNNALKNIYSLTEEANEKIDKLKNRVDGIHEVREGFSKVNNEVETVKTKFDELKNITHLNY